MCHLCGVPSAKDYGRPAAFYREPGTSTIPPAHGAAPFAGTRPGLDPEDLATGFALNHVVPSAAQFIAQCLWQLARRRSVRMRLFQALPLLFRLLLQAHLALPSQKETVEQKSEPTDLNHDLRQELMQKVSDLSPVEVEEMFKMIRKKAGKTKKD